MPVERGNRGERPTAVKAPPSTPHKDTGFRSVDLTAPKKTAKPAPAAAPAPVVAPATPTAPAGKAATLAQTEPKAPGAPKAPIIEPPNPVLQQYGYHKGGIQTFNQRTQSVVDSYTKAYGVKPSPGLVFDLARSAVDEKDFDHMFTVPQSQFGARNRGLLTQHGITDQHEPLDAETLAAGIMKSAATGDYHQFLTQHEEAIRDASSDKKDAATLAGAVFKARRLAAFRDIETRVNDGKLSPLEGREQLQQMGFIPGGSAFHELKGVGGELALGIGQITDNLVHAPAGMYELGKAIGLDTRDNYTGKDNSFSRTRKMGKAMAVATAEDFRHPVQNPGNLFLDILGLATPVAEAGARVTEAGRLARAGEVGAAAKQVVTKSPLRRATLQHGYSQEEMPLSQNPLVAAAQKFILDRRAAGASRRLEADGVPSGLRSVLMPGIAQEFIDKQLSFEKKMGREADVRKRIDHVVDMTLPRELDHVAGRAVMLNRVQAAMPQSLRKGLTRGEQKAIQVQSWDTADPFATERAFHEDMIAREIGDPKAHKQQLVDLALAEKAMKNPSERFLKALALTRQVIERQQDMKIQDLGLLPEVADGRVANAGVVLRGESLPDSFKAADKALTKTQKNLDAETRRVEKLKNELDRIDNDPSPLQRPRDLVQSHLNVAQDRVTRLQASVARAERKAESAHDNPYPERVSDESFYMPTQPRGKVKRPPSDRAGFYSPKVGPFGIPPGRDMPELNHSFTGKALQSGDYRIDATSLATEAYARTVRAVTVREEHSRLWEAASETPRGPYDVPIRDVNTIPDKLRSIVARLDEGSVSPADVEGLPTDIRSLIEELYPSDEKIRADQIQIEHVRWVDGRLLGEGSTLPHVPGLGARVAQTVQAPLRFTTLYLRPAYILNKLGNHAMLWYDQGIHTVPNFIKAMSAESRYGEENARTIRALVGAGRAQSYVTSTSGKMSHAVAEFWARVADRDERVTSFIYYMEQKGFKSREEVERLLHDDEHRADLHEITRRANKALVEFDNLLPIEKNYIRHWIFVYPWVSRSAVWSIRAILEHPTKAAILNRLGQQDLENDPLFHNAPAFFKRIGYVPLGFNHDGTVRVVNPTSVNTFSTLGDFMALGRAAVVGDKYASAEDFLGPFPKYFIHAATGRDEFGNVYPGSQWWSAAKDVLLALPQLTAAERAARFKKGTPKPAQLAHRKSLETALHANLKATVMSPGWLDGFGSLLAGGLSPRSVNLDALAERYWRDQDPQKRHERELDLLNRALHVQGEALGRSVPADVSSAVKDQANIDFFYKKFLKDTGRTPTDKERAGFIIDYLRKKGSMPDAAAKDAHAALKPLADPTDISRLRGQILDKYANGKALRQWDTDVRAIASFTPEIVNQKAASLFSQGLVPQRSYTTTQQGLYDYGRKFVAFTHEAEKLRKQVQEGKKTQADLRTFQDNNDHPVDGLPSFVRMAWSNLTPAHQQHAIAAAATGSWGSLTAFEKTLLGRPSDPKVTAGWAKLREIESGQRTELKRQGRKFPAKQGRVLAQYVEKYYDAPGLTKDYDFAHQPLYARMKYLKPIQNSPNRDTWTTIFSYAKRYHQYLTEKDSDGNNLYNSTQVRQFWRDYVDKSLVPNLPAQFKAEMSTYGRGVLYGMVS